MLTPALLLPKVLSIAEQASAVILQHYTQGTTVSTKADASPVTAADEAGEAVILAGLRALTPDIPIVAEEAVAKGECRMSATAPSGWSIRSTAPRSSSPRTASSPSTSA